MKPEKRNGKWRVRVYIGEVDGKKKWKSVTADTKKDALMQAAKIDVETVNASGTVEQLCQEYIRVREGVLSPSSVRGYKQSMARIKGTKLGGTNIRKVKSAIVQEWVSSMAREVSPKTVRNVYGLFSAMMKMYAPDIVLRIRFPQKINPNLKTPSSDDVKNLMEYFSDDKDMRIAIMLAACGSMRRGEICALDASDIDRKKLTATISKDMVLTATGEYVIKQCPKTNASNRLVPLPKAVIDILPESGPVVSILPEQVSNRFARAKRKLNLPIRFHDLRSYWATILMYAGMDMSTLKDVGGWASDTVMKQIYMRSITDEKEKRIGEIRDVFSDVFGES